MPLPGAEAPGLQDIETWVNSEPLDIGEDVRLVDFWSSSCADCARKASYLQALNDRYPVEVVGVHSPDFKFEKDVNHLERAVEKLGIDYPVAHDPDRSTWEAYGHRTVPRQYLVIDGKIEWHSAGKDRDIEKAVSDSLGVEKKAEASHSHDSRVAWLGYERCGGVNDGSNFRGEKELEAPGSRKTGSVYLSGSWRQDSGHIEAVEDPKLFLPFNGSRLDAVIHPGGGIRDVEVRLDGEPLDEEDAGEDVRFHDGRSYIRAKNPGIYRLVDSGRESAELGLLPEPRTRLHSLTYR
ncbi:MAG: redoxin domain-containing protein [Candidatus Nanohaloarchaea archaeon]